MNDSGSVDITVYQTDGKEDTDALLESNDPRINGPEYGNCMNSGGGLPQDKQSSSSIKSLFSGHQCCQGSCICYSSCKYCHAAAVINFRGWLKQEIIMLLKLALPITLSILFQYSMLLISLFFIGHIPNSDSALYYGSAGLASSFVNVTSTPIGHGLGTAADTLCSQAFGHKNYKRVGIIFQRGILILGVFILPICGLWINAKSLLLLLHQPPCIASLSAFYVNVYCITLPFLFLYILLQHYLQSQNFVWQFVLIGLVANCTNLMLHALLIYAFHLGFKGAVVALVISTCLPTVLVIFYIRFRKLHKLTWGGWSLESLDEWGQFLKLALPGMAMMCLEWWALEVASFVAGTISEEELATNAAWFQATYFIYMPTIGISMAISIRVGNELGAGNPSGAKKVSFVAIGCTLCLCVLYTVFILATKDYIGILFVPGNEVVRKKITNLMYVVCIYIYFDHAQIVIGGVFRGSGRQYIGAIMNFIGYYIIGLPLGITLALKVKWGVLGLWIGMNFGCAFLCLTFIVILLRTNWKKQSEIAILRARKDGERVDTSSKAEPSNEEDEPEQLGAELNQAVRTLNELHEDEVALLSDSAEEIPLNELQQTSEPDSSIEVETGMNSEAQNEQQAEIEHESRTVHAAQDSDTLQLKSIVKRSRGQILIRALSRGTFFAIGLTILVAGGVASNYHPYYIDPAEYENCTTAQMNETMT